MLLDNLIYKQIKYHDFMLSSFIKKIRKIWII